jgi:hypothetical protein
MALRRGHCEEEIEPNRPDHQSPGSLARAIMLAAHSDRAL